MNKRLLYCFLLCIFAVQANAQITIGLSDVPAIGERWTNLNDGNSLPGLTITPGGANQSWDYSSGWVVSDTTFIEYVSPSGLTGAGFFPTATIASVSVNPSNPTLQFNQFFSTANNTWDYLGLYGNAGFFTINIAANNATVFPLPLTYGYSATKTVMMTSVILYDVSFGLPASKEVAYETIQYECDAWGTLTTPAETASVLRLKQTTVARVDSTFLDSTGTGTNFIFDSVDNTLPSAVDYSFFKNGPGSALLAVSAEISTGEITYNNYLDNSITALENVSPRTASMYPNPASGMVHFVTSGNTNATLQLVDMMGRSVFTYNLNGVDNLTFPTTSFENGLYSYRVVDANGKIINTGKLLIQN